MTLGMPMIQTNQTRLSTGIDGLDQIVDGGLLPQRAYLVRGGPGGGKTTLGVQYLIHDTAGGSLFVTLGESEDQLRANAAHSGLAMDEVAVLDLSPGQPDVENSTYSLLESWDVEGSAIHDAIVEHVGRHRPARIFIDSLTHLRYLSPDLFQFRKQVMSLVRTLTSAGATVLFSSEEASSSDDQTLPFLSDGIITLELTDHGRLLSVAKMRGSDFAAGTHYFHLGAGGITAFPRLLPQKHGRKVDHETLGSGIAAMDELLHGGIERGTVTLISGPTGVGKTTLGAQFVRAAAARGERAVIYNFDERESTFIARCRQLGLPIKDLIGKGMFHFEAIEPLHYNPDLFAAVVREEVETRGATMVMLDSLSGYQHSVRGENLQERVHALCRYLTNMGVTVILVNEVMSLTGPQARVSEYGVSYVADNVILLRYIELDGELRKTVGVLKKRAGNFEQTLRDFQLGPDGIQVGAPLTGLRGILSGMPEMIRGGPAAT